MKPAARADRVGPREPQLHGERAGDQQTMRRDDERLDVAEAAVLQEEDDEDVEGGEDDAPEERQVEEQVQGDGGADDFGQVAGGDGDFAEDPEEDRRRARVAVAAGLREVASAGDAEAGGERLQQDRHQVRDHDDAQERVAVAGAAGEVGGPVARVHVADRDQVARAGEGQHLSPEPRAGRAPRLSRGPRGGSARCGSQPATPPQSSWGGWGGGGGFPEKSTKIFNNKTSQQ